VTASEWLEVRPVWLNGGVSECQGAVVLAALLLAVPVSLPFTFPFIFTVSSSFHLKPPVFPPIAASPRLRASCTARRITVVEFRQGMDLLGDRLDGATVSGTPTPPSPPCIWLIYIIF
jgi:hypothetical protein